MNNQKQYVLTLSGSRVAVLRIDVIVSIKNFPAYKKLLDSIKINQKDYLNTVGAIKDILTKGGRVNVSTIGMNRLFDSHDAILQKVTTNLIHETGSAYKKAMISGNEQSDILIVSDDVIDFVPSTECPVQLKFNSSQSYYLFPVYIMGSEAPVAYVEKFLSEVSHSSQALAQLNDFVTKLPVFKNIKEDVPATNIMVIPPEVDTYAFIRGRINAEKRDNIKNKKA